MFLPEMFHSPNTLPCSLGDCLRRKVKRHKRQENIIITTSHRLSVSIKAISSKRQQYWLCCYAA